MSTPRTAAESFIADLEERGYLSFDSGEQEDREDMVTQLEEAIGKIERPTEPPPAPPAPEEEIGHPNRHAQELVTALVRDIDPRQWGAMTDVLSRRVARTLKLEEALEEITHRGDASIKVKEIARAALKPSRVRKTGHAFKIIPVDRP